MTTGPIEMKGMNGIFLTEIYSHHGPRENNLTRLQNRHSHSKLVHDYVILCEKRPFYSKYLQNENLNLQET